MPEHPAASQSPGGPSRVLIAGGGVAAIEALLALHDLAQERVVVELLTPEAEFSYRPLAVAEPFGLGDVRRYDLARIAADMGAELRIGSLEQVNPEARQVTTSEGSKLEYDLLLVTVGARAQTALPGAITPLEPGYSDRFRTLLQELESGSITSVAFAVPGGVAWPLPLYELALMTAGRVATTAPKRPELWLVTPEAEPLELFGPEAARAVRGLLEQRGISLRTGCYPAALEEGRLAVIPSGAEAVPAERVVSLPQLLGPRIPGLPSDNDGFVPTDLHARVHGEGDVYAAGDATSFPIKQGGIATQQADAAAEAIAARAGAPLTPRPFRPVLRGLILTGESPRYLRAEVSGGRGADWDVSEHALWWPPSKIAGHYLSPYLAAHHQEIEQKARESGALPVEVSLEGEAGGGIRRRAIIAPRTGGGRAVQPIDPDRP